MSTIKWFFCSHVCALVNAYSNWIYTELKGPLCSFIQVLELSQEKIIQLKKEREVS